MTINQVPEASETPATSTPPSGSKSWLTKVPLWAKVGIPVVVVVIVAAAVAIPIALQPGSMTVRGEISVSNTNGEADACAIPGYEDVREGANVTVTDASHKTIALGSLGAGHSDGFQLSCIYRFVVTDVPAGLKFYGVEVSHRGSLQYTDAQLKKGVALSIG